MQKKRTFFRIMVDNLVLNNVLFKTIAALVNFCNEFDFIGQRQLKFSKNVPLYKKEYKAQNNYSTRYIFTNTAKYEVNVD